MRPIVAKYVGNSWQVPQAPHLAITGAANLTMVFHDAILI
jgi:hypothetical protein